MGNDAELLRDPVFCKLLARRSRWRWWLSGSMIGAYLVWAVGSIYFAEAYAAPIMNSAIPWGIAAGLLIILVSIVLSIVYVGVVNRLEAEESIERERQS